MRLVTTVQGNMADMVMQDIARAERAHTRAMSIAAAEFKNIWRDDIRDAGLGTKLSNTVRSAAYPQGGQSLNAAAMVWTRAPKIVSAHDEGATIRSRDGFWLAIPLPAAGAGPRGRKITPGEFEQRTGQRLRFVYRSKRSSLLVVDDARLTTRGQARRKGGRRRKDGILTGAQTVPVFVLVPQVSLRKRTDLISAADSVAARIGDNMINWEA